MGRNGTGASSATAAGKYNTQNTPGPASLTVGESPVPFRPAFESRGPSAFDALGLAKMPGGFVVMRLRIAGDRVVRADPITQPEPQRAVAFAYLEAAVSDLYVSGEGK